jgi:hypothetical protein
MSQTRAARRPGAAGFQDPERDVAGAARHVEQPLPVARRQPVDHRVLPQPVDADPLIRSFITS